MHEDIDLDSLEDKGQDVNLSAVEKLVEGLLQKEKELGELEEKVSFKKKEIDDLKTRTIPDAMGKLKQVKVDYGGVTWTVSVEPVIRANIAKENRPKAFEWMDSSGHGDLIKTEITMSYGRNELPQAKQTIEKLKVMGIAAELNQDVHWATLNAFAKEQLNKGMEFPDFIGIYEGKTTKVKHGK